MIFFKDIILKYCFVFALFSVLLVTESCEDNEKEIPSPTIFIDMPEDGYELEIKDTIIISPKITYDYNSRYQWYLNGERSITTKTFKHISSKLGEDIYSFVVENPQGKDSIAIPVRTIIQIDFNDFSLTDGYDVGLNLPDESSWFSSKGALFPVTATSETQWTGFGMSNLYSQLTTSTDIYSAYATTDKDNIFLLYNQSPSPYISAIRFEDDKNHLVGSILVCNSTLTYLVIKYGTDEIRHFGGDTNNLKDWYLLTFEGYDNNENFTGKVDFYLADYRSDNNKRDFIIGTWTNVDLSSLGQVNRITLNLTSSVLSEGGEMLTPAFVCIDDLKVLN